MYWEVKDEGLNVRNMYVHVCGRKRNYLYFSKSELQKTWKAKSCFFLFIGCWYNLRESADIF